MKCDHDPLPRQVPGSIAWLSEFETLRRILTKRREKDMIEFEQVI